MYDLINNVYLDAYVQPGRKVNEFRALTDMVDGSTLTGKVLVVADRGYESYNVFAHIMKKGWKFLIRVKDTKSQSMLSSFKLPDGGEFDRQIKHILTSKQTKAIKAQPDVYKFLPTSSTFDYLDSAEASIEQILEYYHMRWGIETSFREIKNTLALTHLHAKKGGVHCTRNLCKDGHV
jgi:IS4 transposase